MVRGGYFCADIWGAHCGLTGLMSSSEPGDGAGHGWYPAKSARSSSSSNSEPDEAICPGIASSIPKRLAHREVQRLTRRNPEDCRSRVISSVLNPSVAILAVNLAGFISKSGPKRVWSGTPRSNSATTTSERLYRLRNGISGCRFAEQGLGPEVELARVDLPCAPFRTDTVCTRGSSLLRACARSVRIQPWDRGYRRGKA